MMVYLQTIIQAIIVTILSGHLVIGTMFRHAGIKWSHEAQEEWPDICLDGKSQSPIALSEAEASEESFKPFSLVNYNKTFNVTVMNNGHTVIFIPSGEKPRISGGGLSGSYVLEEMHFHWCSEHTIERHRFPLEAHLVHYAEKYKHIEEAIRHQEGIAVLGVLFDLSPYDDEVIEKLYEIIPTLRSKLNQPTSIPQFIFRDFLPRNLGGFYRYDGSLTTPHCNEIVVWTVFTTTIEISERQERMFYGMHTEDSKILEDNFRKLQPLNSRKLSLQKSKILSDRCNNSTDNRMFVHVIFIFLLITSCSYF